MYSPLGLVIFVAVEGTFVCFTKGQDHLFQIQFVAAANEQTNVISRAPKLQLTEMYWQLTAAPLRGGDELSV